jgi:general secretion pathway protein N
MLTQLEGRQPATRGRDPGAATPSGSPFLEGATVTVAGAGLLQRVSAAVTKLGGNVLSSQVDLQGTQSKAGFLSIIASCEIDQPGRPARRATARKLYGLRRRQDARPACGLRSVARFEMRRSGEMRRLIRHAFPFLLVSALAIPVPSAALQPTDASDADDTGRQGVTGAASAPSLWEQAEAPPLVAKASKRPQPAVKPEGPPSANPLWAIPLSTLSNTRERPIFSSSRRPPPPVVAPAPVAKAPPLPPKPPRVERPQLSLVGTIAGDDQGIGIFVDQTTNAALRLKIGEDYQGWKLRSVHGRDVTFERDEQRTILSLPQSGADPAMHTRVRTENTVAQGMADVPPDRKGRR